MFLSHIGKFQSFLCLILIFVYILDNLFSLNISLKEDNFFNILVMLIYFFSSLFYIFKYKPMKVENIKKSVDYKKIAPVINLTGTNVFIRGTTQFRADARNSRL